MFGDQHCMRMNRVLDELAPTMPHVKFLRMNAAHAATSGNTVVPVALDRMTLPILTIYRYVYVVTAYMK